MKNIFRTAAVSALVCSALLAQRPGPRAAGGGTAPDPATRIAHQVERLTTLLDLTSTQATQIITILTSADSATTSARSTLATDQTALAAAVKSNVTGTIDQLASAIAVLQGQILAANSKAEGAIYVLLTSAQQTKLDTVGGVGALGGGRGPGGPGGRGPGGPPRE